MKRFLRAILFPALFSIGPGLFFSGLVMRPEPWIVWVIGFLAIMTQPDAPYLPTTEFLKDAQDQNSARLIIVAIYVVGGTSLALFVMNAFYRNQNVLATYLLAGTFLATLGMFVRVLAIRTLGKMFTVQVRILPDHELVTRGPFRFVRHPSYLGAILSFGAIPLVYGLPWVSLGALALLYFAYRYRIQVEEKALLVRFGSGYVNYQERVGALLPKIF